jgi:hypothetical protein
MLPNVQNLLKSLYVPVVVGIYCLLRRGAVGSFDRTTPEGRTWLNKGLGKDKRDMRHNLRYNLAYARGKSGNARTNLTLYSGCPGRYLKRGNANTK